MARLTRVTQIVDSINAGDYTYSYMYKPSVTAVGTATMWVDGSMSSGTPKYNAYAGSALEATQLVGLGNAGIFNGSTPSAGDYRHLVRVGMATASAITPAYVSILDYLMFYPLIDMDSVDQQDFTNSVSLPRYTDGVGVRAFLVATVPNSAETDVTINYTNTNNEAKSVTSRILIGASTGVIITGSQGISTTGNTPLIELAAGDIGMKSVESVQLSAGVGGFACLVLVKPLTNLNIYENNTFSEVNLINDRFQAPRIYDGAYLNFIMKTGASAASAIRGEFLFVTT